MTLPAVEEFIFDSLLLDLGRGGRRMRKIADVSTRRRVRIVAQGPI